MRSAEPKCRKSNRHSKIAASKQHRTRRAFFETLENRNLLIATVHIAAVDTEAAEPFTQDQAISTMNKGTVVFTRDDTTDPLCVPFEHVNDDEHPEAPMASPYDWHLATLTDPEGVTICSGYSTYSGIEFPDGVASVTAYVIAEYLDGSPGGYEPDENLRLRIVPSINNNTDYDSVNTEIAEFTILDTTQVVSIRAADPAYEPGEIPGTFIAKRESTFNLGVPLHIDFAVTGGTATLGTDYALDWDDLELSGTIPADETEVVIILTPVEDSEKEGTETVTLSLLFGPGNDFKSTGSATNVILEGDAPKPMLPGCGSCGSPGTGLNASGLRPMMMGVAQSGGNAGWTSAPIRYADGAVFIGSTDLTSSANGIPWGVTREWTNKSGYSDGLSFGNGMSVEEQPNIIQVDGDGTLAVITNGHTAYFFDQDTYGAYHSLAFLQETLTHNDTTDELIFTTTDGSQYTFFDFTATPLQQGELKTFKDAGGNVITMHYNSPAGSGADAGQLDYAERSSTVGGVTVTERLQYAYVATGPAAGAVASVLLRRKTGSGDWSPTDKIRKVAYDYYLADEEHGNPRDLKSVTVKQMDGDTETDIDVTYYRYYKDDDIYDGSNLIGYTHGLKYVFGPDSYARLVAAQGSNLDDIDDVDASPFADNYFQYDTEQRAVLEKAQGAGCGCSGGLGTFQYDYEPSENDDGYNSWAMKTTETLPDGNQNIVYTNYLGEVMLKIFHDADTDGTGPDTDLGQWATFYKYDNDGRVVLVAEPSAITGTDANYDAYADLLHSSSGNYQYLRDSAGLITTYSYSTSTSATATLPGYVAGYLTDVAIQNGETASMVAQSHYTYFKHSVGDNSTFFPYSSTVYPTAGSTAGALITTSDYTFYSNSHQVESQTTTDPSGAVTKVYFDAYGRPTWTMDAAGYINSIEYDQATGAVTKTVVDESTTAVSNEPAGWTSPTGTRLRLTTQYEVDSLGRVTKSTQQVSATENDVTYIRYDEVNREVRVYPGFVATNPTTGTTTGPTVILRENRSLANNSYMEVLTTSAAPTVAGSRPVGNDTLTNANIQSLTRTFFNDAGQPVLIDEYFDLTGVTELFPSATTLHPGTSGTKYYQTEIQYDSRGRQSRIKSGDGTIFRTIYDGLGRPVTESVGNDDSATSLNNMVVQKHYHYDADGVGDSHLTGVTDALSHTTTLDYDFRGRLTATTLPDPDAGGSQTASQYSTAYDNLDRVTSTTDALTKTTSYAYNASARTVTVTQPDPDGSGSLSSPVTIQTYNSRGLLANLRDPDSNDTSWTYDGAGRVVNETNELAASREFAYDGASRLTQRVDRNGRVINYEYDHAGRNTYEKWYDDTTLVRTIGFSYDSAGNLSQATDPSATYNYTDYDALGRLKDVEQIIDGLTPHVQYASLYNGASALTDVQATIDGTADFKNTYGYDDLGRIHTITQQSVSSGNAVAGKHAVFEYNNANQVREISRYQATSATELAINTFYDYDYAGRLKTLLHTMDSALPSSGWGTAPNPKAGYVFGYDNANRITSINSMTDGSTSYSYDHTNQLTTADHPSGQTDEAYSYDVNGNRTMSGYSTDTNNRLESDGIYTYRYDAEGNRTRKTNISTGTYTQYSYDHRNRLIQVDTITPTASEYVPEDSDSGSLSGGGVDWGWGSDSGSGGYYVPNYDEESNEIDPVWFGVSASVESVREGMYAQISLTFNVTAPNNVEIACVNYSISASDVSATYDDDYVLTGTSGLYCTDYQSNTAGAWIIPTDDEITETIESYSLHIEIDGQGGFDIEGDIFDNDGGSGPGDFTATATSALEGDDVQLSFSRDAGVFLEYYIQGVTAANGTNFIDSNYSSETNWVGVGWVNFSLSHSIYIPTVALSSQDGTLTFLVHVRPVGDPSSEITVEANIADVEESVTSRVEYGYDLFNQLIRRSEDADGPDGTGEAADTFYSHLHGQIALQFDGDAAGDLSHRYFWGAAVDQLLADEQVSSLSSAGAILWPLADQVGTIRDLATHNDSTDETTIANHRVYDAFGNLVSETNSAIDEIFGFTSRLFDEATGLQNNLNRWYDPKTGIWISEDPIGFRAGDANLSRYVGNSPLDFTDPTGLERKSFPWRDFWAAQGWGQSEWDQFRRGCVGLSLARVGHLNEGFPHLVPGAVIFKTFEDADRFRQLNAKQGNPYGIVAIQVSTPLRPYVPQPPGFLTPADNRIDPSQIEIPADGHFNFATYLPRQKAWEWMNHYVNEPVPAGETPCKVYHSDRHPSDTSEFKFTYYAVVPLSANSHMPNVER